MGQLMRASGTFEVTMAATNGNDGAKGAKPIMLYWDECASTFQFKAGVGGEDVYHIVWETRSATPGTATAFLCIATHTKSSTRPSADSTHWQRLSNLAMIATDLMLTRQILASEIDVDNLTVKNVNAVSNDGKTTCHIDGETGKLSAKNSDFEGVNAVNMTATNVTAKNMSVDGMTATNADVIGKITATSGKVAGFSISGDGLTNEGFNNDAYLVFRNDTNKCFAGIGGNVLPATSGARAVARFENHDEGDMWGLGANYGAIVSAQGAQTNVALHIDGGSVCGFAYKNKVVSSSGSLTLGRYDNNIVAINTTELTLSLPSMKLYDDGHSIRIKRLGTGALKIKVSTCSTYNSDGSERTSSPCLIYDENATLIPGNTLSFESICDSMELVWVRDINRTYNNVTYYGCWVQYKIPRAW